MSNPLDINATIVGSTVELHYSSHGEAVNQLDALRQQLEHYRRLLASLAGMPAFPQSSAIHDKGMTLRDHFATHAPLPAAPMLLEDHCAYRYRYADAMLAARAANVDTPFNDFIPGPSS